VVQRLLVDLGPRKGSNYDDDDVVVYGAGHSTGHARH